MRFPVVIITCLSQVSQWIHLSLCPRVTPGLLPCGVGVPASHLWEEDGTFETTLSILSSASMHPVPLFPFFLPSLPHKTKVAAHHCYQSAWVGCFSCFVLLILLFREMCLHDFLFYALWFIILITAGFHAKNIPTSSTLSIRVSAYLYHVL